MATTKFTDLPTAIDLDGSEVVAVVQPGNASFGVSKKATIAQIANFNTPSLGLVSMRQMRAALADPSQDGLWTVNNAVPGDISNSVNIAWFFGNTVGVGSTVALFIQSTLGYNDAQMLALFTLALTFPY